MLTVNLDIESSTDTTYTETTENTSIDSFVWRNGLKIRQLQRNLNKKQFSPRKSNVWDSESTSVDKEPEYYQRYKLYYAIQGSTRWNQCRLSLVVPKLSIYYVGPLKNKQR